MRDEQLAAIKARAEYLRTTPFFQQIAKEAHTQQIEDIPALLAEVERLRAFVVEVAGDHQHIWDAVDPQEVWTCDICHEVSHDYAEVIQQDARATLGLDA